jgi:hypothetical protein
MGKFWDWVMSDKPCFEYFHIDTEDLQILERMQMNKYKYDLLTKHPELKDELQKIKQERVARERWIENK